ncbi:hypothetical protein Lal_00031963 [Lupinus albus]|nr:hypothetical protein Lal_00031963 [Lupinus albus]
MNGHKINVQKSKDGRFVENVVINKEFWNNIVVCLKDVYPLIKVLQLVDLDEKLALGFIYEAMNQAKENIQIAYDVKKVICRYEKSLI